MSTVTHSLSLSRTLQHRVFRNTIHASLLTVIVFGVCSYYFHSFQQRQHAHDLAAVTAASITPSANGDLSESIHHLRQNWDRMRAVATLDPDNRVLAVLPNDPTFLQVAQQAVACGQHWSTLSTTRANKPEQLIAMVVPLWQGQSTLSRRIVVILEHNFDWANWIKSNLYFVAIVFCVNIAYGFVFAGWFVRKVSRPMGALVRVATSCEDVTELPANLRSDRWEEFSKIYDALWRVKHEQARHDTNMRRMKRESEWKLRDREIGLGRQLRRAEEQATNDPLTKLGNRRFLDLELEPLFAAQLARQEDLSIVMIDVDYFKEHNDTLGHTSGDTILVFVGELLRGAIRPTDHAVRYGGDEFVLLLPNTDEQSALSIADRIVKLFAQYAATKSDPTTPTLSLSAGVASLVGSTSQRGIDLLTKADQALYDAKKNGKNTVSTAA